VSFGQLIGYLRGFENTRKLTASRTACGYEVQDIIRWVPVKWKRHRGSEPGIQRADIVQVNEKAIKGNITRKGRARVQSARRGIACVCVRSLRGIGRRRE